MTLVAALAAASTFAVVAATVSGVWRIVWALVAVLLLGPVVSHLISLRQPRRLFLHPRGLGSATFHLDAEVHWDAVTVFRLASSIRARPWPRLLST